MVAYVSYLSLLPLLVCQLSQPSQTKQTTDRHSQSRFGVGIGVSIGKHWHHVAIGGKQCSHGRCRRRADIRCRWMGCLGPGEGARMD